MFVRRYRRFAWRPAAAIAALAAWLSCGPAAAADPLSLIDGSHDVRSVAARSRLARELAQEITAALSRIGAPAPAESAAVLDELAAIDRLRDPGAVNARAHRLYASAPFHHLRLTNTLAVVSDALSCAASERDSVRREMACWAIAAAYLAQRGLYDGGLEVLTRSGRLAYAGGMTPSRWLAQAAAWSHYGIAIQDYITLPYMSGRWD